MLFKFSDTMKKSVLDEVKLSNFTKIEKAFSDHLKGSGNKSLGFMSTIDTLATNDIWRVIFSRELSKLIDVPEKKLQFKVLTDEERTSLKNFKKMQGYVVDATTDLDDVFQTDILETLDGLLINSDPFLSLLTYDTPSEGKLDIDEFIGEQVAQELAENGAGSDADDVIRDGDSLNANNNKIQRSTTISNQALLKMSAQKYARYVARLFNSVKSQIMWNVLQGTNASNQFKGIINSFGAAEGDQEGALQFTPSTPVDDLDKLDQMLADMPNRKARDTNPENQAIFNRMRFVMTPKTWRNKFNRLRDNQNLKMNTADLRAMTTFVEYGLAENRVLLIDPTMYIVAVGSPFQFIDDRGIVGIKEGQTILVARQFLDGGMGMAHKNAVGSGAGANDNQARNLFRYTDI